jgi:hypothetical protein
MNYVSVRSSTLEAVAYDETSSTLGVRFRNGSEYEYSRVPESVYRGILSAPSAGRYFQTHVKDAGFRFRRVR